MSRFAGRERRRNRRFDVEIKVDYQTRDIFTSNYVMNLSKGGVFIQSDSPHPIGTEIHLTFTLPELNTTIQVNGEVAWTYDIQRGTSAILPGMGIRFIDLSPEDKKQLEATIENLSSPTA